MLPIQFIQFIPNFVDAERDVKIQHNRFDFECVIDILFLVVDILF